MERRRGRERRYARGARGHARHDRAASGRRREAVGGHRERRGVGGKGPDGRRQPGRPYPRRCRSRPASAARVREQARAEDRSHGPERKRHASKPGTWREANTETGPPGQGVTGQQGRSSSPRRRRVTPSGAHLFACEYRRGWLVTKSRSRTAAWRPGCSAAGDYEHASKPAD